MHTTTPIAENRISISRALFDEGMRAAENGKYKKSVQKLALILLVLYLGVAIWLIHSGSSLFFLLGESIFLGALIFWLTVMLPGTKRRSKYRTMAREKGRIPQRTVKFYPDELSVVTDTGRETVIPYSDVQGWQETRHLYILCCKNNLRVLLDKDGFVHGDFHSVTSKIQ